MRLRVIYRDLPESGADAGLFRDVFVTGQARWPSLAASAAGHAIVLVLLPVLVQVAASFTPLEPDLSAASFEPLRLVVPDHLYLPTVRLQQKQTNDAPVAAATPPTPAPGRQPALQEISAKAAPKPRVTVPKQLGLPATQHISDTAPVILQPDPMMIPKPVVPVLPSMAFWTGVPSPPERRKAVIPGRRRESSSTPNLDAPPSLRLSTPQPTAAEIASHLPSTNAAPKLLLPSASSNPVRIKGKGAAEIASFDVSQSDPVNLIYLMADNTQTKQAEIPRGLTNTPRQTSDGGSELSAARAAEQSEKSESKPAPANDHPKETAEGASHSTETAKASAPANGTHTAANNTAPANGQTPNTPAANPAANPAVKPAANAAPAAAPPANAASASNSPAPASGASSNAARNSQPETVAANGRPGESPVPAAAARPPASSVPNNDAAVIRVTHPANGNFDVILLQSVSFDPSADAAVTLTGNPVYTVYISVGDTREWLLEYCIPAAATPRGNSFQVSVGDSGPVSAPYPLSTVIPKNVADLPHPKDIVLHGLLSVAGNLRDVKAPGTENALLREVLPLLNQWQFRPALRDQVPVEVEVLLIIPART